jgi:DNA-directed RNA polymerase subunit RPC12/RpoP
MSVRLIALKVNSTIEIRPGELRCPRCLSRDVAPSMPRGIWDDIMRGAGRIPRHCRYCGRRFHAKIEAIQRDTALRDEEVKARSSDFTETGF